MRKGHYDTQVLLPDREAMYQEDNEQNYFSIICLSILAPMFFLYHSIISRKRQSTKKRTACVLLHRHQITSLKLRIKIFIHYLSNQILVL